MVAQRTDRIIVGLGTTGLSCARYLRAMGVECQVVDNRQSPPALEAFRQEFADVPVTLGEFPQALLNDAKELIVSPGVSIATPAIREAEQAGVVISGDIDIFSRQVKGPVVAVTGSNGKSTVVSLLAAMARAAGLKVGLGGNLDGAEAAPALDLLRQDVKDLYILELSSFQLETTRSLNAEAAVILNVSDDHMDRYEDKHAYEAAKQRIFIGARHIVVNRDDASSQPWQDATRVLSSFGLSVPGAGQWGLLAEADDYQLVRAGERVLKASEMRIVGRHNLANALAALALGDALGLPLPAMQAALCQFPGLPHRCQWLRSLRGVDYYNDSKGTNVGATIVAIESLGEMLKGRLVLIAGGIDKEADFSIMKPVLQQFVKLAVLIGRDARHLAAAFKDSIEVIFAASLPEAVNMAASRAREGDAVLLSPACASYDMFRDFTHRGQVFAQAVEELQ